MASHKYVVEKGRNILIALQIIVDFLLWYFTKTQSVTVTQRLLQCGVWSHISELLLFYYIKISLIYLALQMGFLPMHGFLTFMNWSFGKYWLTEVSRSSKYHLLISSPVSSVLGSYQVSADGYNSHFCLKAQILSLTTDPISYFPWNDRLSLFIFEKMSVRYPE